MPVSDPIQLSRALHPPKSLPEFTECFATESACEEFLFRIRYPKGFVCPTCQEEHGWALNGRRLIECRNGHKSSLTSGTALHGTRMELLTWFLAVYLVTTLTPGISALQFQRQMGLKRYETAFRMLHKIRSVLVAPGREVLRHEVEVDETFVGGRDPDRDGRGGDKVLVAGAVEVMAYSDLKTQSVRQRTGRVRLQVVPNARAASLVGFVKREVEAGALVHTDGWDGYRPLSKAGYTHQRWIQGKNQALTPVLPHIHRLFSNLKAWLQGTHHGRVEPKYLQAYLNEFTFRFNRRFWRGPAFLRALTLLVEADYKIWYPPNSTG